MRHYEIVVLLGVDQHDRGTAMAERYRTMVSDGGGAVHRFEDWGSRTLAYPIGKRQRARYFLFNIECGAETLGKLKDDFRYSEIVIRSLVIRRDRAVSEESPMLIDMKKRAEEEAAAAAETAAVEAAAAEAAASAPTPPAAYGSTPPQGGGKEGGATPATPPADAESTPSPAPTAAADAAPATPASAAPADENAESTTTSSPQDAGASGDKENTDEEKK